MVADGIVYELLRLPSGAMRDVGQSIEVAQRSSSGPVICFGDFVQRMCCFAGRDDESILHGKSYFIRSAGREAVHEYLAAT